MNSNKITEQEASAIHTLLSNLAASRENATTNDMAISLRDFLETIIEIEEFTRVDFKILSVKRYSLHPDEQHLAVVLCSIPKGAQRFATWVYNTDTKERVWGHYFDTLNAASADFDKRGIE